MMNNVYIFRCAGHTSSYGARATITEYAITGAGCNWRTCEFRNNLTAHFGNN